VADWTLAHPGVTRGVSAGAYPTPHLPARPDERPGARRSRPAASSPHALASWVRQVCARAGEVPLVVALVGLGLLAHGLNMAGYPAFTLKDDEGIYVSQAWAVLREGRLSPYTYFYDHAPAGWLLLAAWMGLTGGPHAHGAAVDSGRQLMLVLHLAMVPLLYGVARKLGSGAGPAALAVALFSVSPLATFYQRLVLLDSIMLFWLLLSLDLLLDGKGRLSRAVLSGLCFGLALLTKETAIVFLPALLLVAVQERWRHQGRFAVVGWLVPMLAIASWYPLYALLKGELFPAEQAAGSVPGATASTTLSLIDALKWQATRTGGGLLSFDNRFWQLVRNDWMLRDPVLLFGGAAATGLNLILGHRRPQALAVGSLGVLPLLYMGRGGIVFDYYILAAIPFLCLNLAALLGTLFDRLGHLSRPGRAALAAGMACALAAVYVETGALGPLYTARPDESGREAIAWIKRNVPANSAIIMRDDMWTSFHEPGLGGPAFPNAHSHVKVASDPAVRDRIFKNDWRTVDYLVTVPDIDDEFAAQGNTVALQALRNAHLVRRWGAESGDNRLHPAQFVELWKVDKPGETERALLAGSAAYIAGRFERDGAFVGADGSVFSESQAYAMLRAVWSDDREGFDRAWAWTQAHLLDSRGLMAWLWRDGKIVDAHSASDADTDAAVALLLAGRRWNDQDLLEAGRRMVVAIWEHQVVDVGGVPYITAGDWANQGAVVALNPSYFSPYAYRIFKQVDPEHDWWEVLNSGYEVLFASSAAPLGAAHSAGLPPDWVGLDRATRRLVPLDLEKGDTTRFGYDAARAYWRVALDLRWVGDGRAAAYLTQAGFIKDEVDRKGYVSAVYERDGAIAEEPPSPVSSAAALAALLGADSVAAHAVHATQIVGGATRDRAGVYWGNPDDLYAQAWGWFSTALYSDALKNLWDKPHG
jgi:endo-1,4-beta-D-glucanase Y